MIQYGLGMFGHSKFMTAHYTYYNSANNFYTKYNGTPIVFAQQTFHGNNISYGYTKPFYSMEYDSSYPDDPKFPIGPWNGGLFKRNPNNNNYPEFVPPSDSYYSDYKNAYFNISVSYISEYGFDLIRDYNFYNDTYENLAKYHWMSIGLK